MVCIIKHITFVSMKTLTVTAEVNEVEMELTVEYNKDSMICFSNGAVVQPDNWLIIENAIQEQEAYGNE